MTEKISECPKLRDDTFVCRRHTIIDQMVGVPFRNYCSFAELFNDICKDCIAQKSR